MKKDNEYLFSKKCSALEYKKKAFKNYDFEPDASYEDMPTKAKERIAYFIAKGYINYEKEELAKIIKALIFEIEDHVDGYYAGEAFDRIIVDIKNNY